MDKICLDYDSCSNYIVWLKVMLSFDNSFACANCKRLVSFRDLQSSRIGLVCVECWRSLMLGVLWKVGHDVA